MSFPPWNSSSSSFHIQTKLAREAHGLTLTGRANPVSQVIGELALMAIPAGPLIRLARGSKVLAALSHARRPMHSALAKGWLTQGRVSPIIQSTLRGRKAVGATAFAYNLINPLETVRYVQAGEFDKALINFFYPIVGVPIYNLVEGSSSHGLVQNGGPPAPLQVSSTVADILSLGKISRPPRNPSAKRQAPRRGPRRALKAKNRCPKGHYWNGRRCVPIRKR